MARTRVILVSVIAIGSSFVGINGAFAFFTTHGSGTGFATADAFSVDDSAITSCPVTNLLPTGTPATACTFTATYAGAGQAYVATDVLIETQAGSGGANLYSPADSTHDLQVTITSTTPSATYTVPTAATACPSGAPSGSTCYELDNELVATTALSATSVGFNVSVKLPTSSPTGYQGGKVQIVLTTHAVSAGTALSCTTTPAAGSTCTPTGSFRWA